MKKLVIGLGFMSVISASDMCNCNRQIDLFKKINPHGIVGIVENGGVGGSRRCCYPKPLTQGGGWVPAPRGQHTSRMGCETHPYEWEP